jgi:hypothetical protein
MRRALAVATVACLLAAGTTTESPASSSSGLRPPGTALADGFVVARGSHLIGTIFRDQQSFGSSWTALFVVDGNPFDAYDRYVEQGRALGYPLPGSGTRNPNISTTCRVVEHGGSTPLDTASDVQVASADAVACDGAANQVHEQTTLTVTIGVYWGGTTHHAVLTVDERPRIAAPVVTDLGTARAPARPHLPEVTKSRVATEPGAAFGPEFNGFERGGYRRFHLERGSRLAGPATAGTWYPIAVLATSDQAKIVLRRYAHQLGVRHPSIQTVELAGGKQALRFSHEVDGGGGASLRTDPSGRWILVEVYSD